MQDTFAELYNYPRIHAPIAMTGHKKASDYDCDDVVAGLKKIYKGVIDETVCLNVTAEEDYKKSVELALLVHVAVDKHDNNVILTAEKQKDRRIIADFVGIFKTLYAAVQKGDCTNDVAYRTVGTQIALRRCEFDEGFINSTIRRHGVFKDAPSVQKGRQVYAPVLKIEKPVAMTTEGIVKFFEASLPKDAYITPDHSWLAKQYYSQLLKEIA